MKILIALDTTSHSERALEFLTCMRWPAGSRFIVATVVPPGATRISSSPTAAGADEPARKRLPRHESVVIRARDRLRACGLPTETRILEGEAREQILRLTEEERADLLVMGSRGHTGILQVMLGSVSSHAVGQARCSVLVVKQGGGAMKILIGVDDSPHSKAAVDFVRRMAWPKDTKVVVLSVIQIVTPVYTEVYGPPSIPAIFEEDLVKAHQEIASTAESSLRSSGLSTEVKVLQGDPRLALVEEAGSQRADLIVVGSHGRSGLAKLFMGSVADYVVTHAPCSVLVVKLERP